MPRAQRCAGSASRRELHVPDRDGNLADVVLGRPAPAIAYDDAYNRSRKGIHAQDALLGLANALAAINEKKASCDTLNRLRGDFPALRPDIRDGVAAASQRAACR